jgi:antitoxin component YwqK of YwqJK toxin-antitoxin module
MRPYILLLFVTLILTGCKDDFDDASKRNENFVWWVDAKTGKASWVPTEGPGSPVQNGRMTRFYSNGKVFSKCKLVNGHWVDTALYYGMDSKPFASEFVKDGDTIMYFLHDGPQKTYAQTGYLTGEGTIDGHTYGHWRKYYESGNLLSIYNLKNDTGWIKNYYENGNREDSNYKYTAGRKSYNIRHWFYDGKLQKGVYLKDNKRTGYWEKYYENRQLEARGTLINGVSDGEIKGWFQNGKLQIIQHVKKTMLDGQQMDYYENGSQKTIQHYKMGVRDGRQIAYYENGKLQLDANVKDGNLDGERKIYSKDGKLTSDEIYEDGNLVERKVP